MLIAEPKKKSRMGRPPTGELLIGFKLSPELIKVNRRSKRPREQRLSRDGSARLVGPDLQRDTPWGLERAPGDVQEPQTSQETYPRYKNIPWSHARATPSHE